MLAISSSAAEAIKDIVTTSGVPGKSGVRITIEPIDRDTAKLELELTETAEPGDALLEQEGANVFVEESTAEMLDGKILDATVRGDGFEFSVIDAPSGLSSNGQGKGGKRGTA